MASRGGGGGYQHSAHLSLVYCWLSSHPGDKELMEAGCLFLLEEKSFFFSSRLPRSFSPAQSRGFIASGGVGWRWGGDKRRQRLVEAATVPKIPLSGSRRSHEYHTRSSGKNDGAVFSFLT